MVRIAVAGGASGLGKTIMDTIRKTTTHECVVLSRTASEDATVVEVDYSNIQNIRKILEKEEIHVVISTIGVYTESHHRSQLNLIEAADLSAVTKRFIPSEFGFVIQPQHADRSPSFPFKLETIERLENSGLEYTLVHTGIFLDYLAWPVVPSALEIQSFIINMRCNRAVIPGSGDRHITFTHTTDIASFVAALLDIKGWQKRYFAFSERMTAKELVHCAEEIKGVKFDIVFDTREQLDQGRCTLLPPPSDAGFNDSRFDQVELYTSYIAKLGTLIDDGVADLGIETSLARICPHIQPLTAHEAISRWVIGNRNR